MALATGSTPAHPADPLRLKRRLLLQGGGFTLLLLSAFSGSLYWGIAAQRAEDQRTELRQLAAGAAAQLPLIAHEVREAEGRTKFRGDRHPIAIAGLNQQRLQWFDRRGALLSEQGTLPLPPLSIGALASRGTPLWQQWPGGLALWQPVLSRQPRDRAAAAAPIGSVRVALSDHAARADLERLRRGLLVGAIGSALVALLVSRRLLRAAFWPLQQQLETLERFTADASHELRHPLTVLRTLLAAIPEELRRQPALAWQELDTVTGRMGELLDDLLFLARQEQAGEGIHSGREPTQHFDLVELLEDLLRRSSPQAASQQVALRLQPTTGPSSVLIRGYSEALVRLFTNLLMNAIRHSPEGGTVTVDVRATERRVSVAVADEGSGIPPQAQERVFDRFWQGSDQGGHSGLGLAIARAIARRHGGELRLGESRPGRCVLLVELPIG